MKVIAIKMGYYGQLREPGDEFDVEDGLKASWFVSADKAVSEKPKSTGKKPQGAPADTGDGADLV
jgi:hypothetical protein